MNSQERLRAQLRALCAEPGPEDGAPLRRKERRSSSNIADLRLAGRVAQSVALALGATEDPVLSTLVVLGGEPDPDARRVRLRLMWPGCAQPAQLDHAHARLVAAQGLLRAAVAQDLQRKATPRLRFVVQADPVSP